MRDESVTCLFLPPSLSNSVLIFRPRDTLITRDVTSHETRSAHERHDIRLATEFDIIVVAEGVPRKRR